MYNDGYRKLAIRSVAVSSLSPPGQLSHGLLSDDFSPSDWTRSSCGSKPASRPIYFSDPPALATNFSLIDCKFTYYYWAFNHHRLFGFGDSWCRARWWRRRMLELITDETIGACPHVSAFLELVPITFMGFQIFRSGAAASNYL